MGTIKAGLLVSNEEGRRRFKEKYDIELTDLQDMNIPLRLSRILRDKLIALGCIYAPRRSDPFMSDFLVITQCLSGCWRNDGPDNYQEVLMEDVKPKETVNEEQVKEWLEKELGIKTSGFKAYFE
ncbi:hypothetical protein GALMADRAFT_134407 [Galerina marginata CBS 339.88]|uniref:Uncharacterized protein n=1 Tax=Galerina marginata (strain CBS 339.88) TaxID=685588 RepID=A0A067TI93_GALM3|nr:hypothetical protein GALMADRAFT_134407 [Galerina marginata CBS 339.88]